MPTEQEWRDKYRDVLSRLAAEEARWSKTQNVLKLLIGRLCLAAQGRDDRLDHEIARVADVARKQIDVDALDLLIAPSVRSRRRARWRRRQRLRRATRPEGGAPLTASAKADGNGLVSAQLAGGGEAALATHTGERQPKCRVAATAVGDGRSIRRHRRPRPALAAAGTEARRRRAPQPQERSPRTFTSWRICSSASRASRPSSARRSRKKSWSCRTSCSSSPRDWKRSASTSRASWPNATPGRKTASSSICASRTK